MCVRPERRLSWFQQPYSRSPHLQLHWVQGGGIAYGTKEGKLRILRHDPRPEARTLATCQQPRGLQDELREAESIYEDEVLL